MVRTRSHSSLVALAVIALAAVVVGFQVFVQAQGDPVVAKIVQLGTTDNQVMTWNDYASNRFGGRETGTNAYTDATQWAAWQFKQWGFDVELDEVGEIPVGFNRGPWFGKMVLPAEKALRFGTPSFTAGTKGAQKGGVVILKSDPFSVPGRSATPENVEKKRAAVQAALAEVNANKGAFAGKWVLIGGTSGFGRDGRRGTPEYADAQLIPPLTRALIAAGALGTIQSSTPTVKVAQGDQPLSMLDGYVESWDKLPVLPDIKLINTQYDEIKGMVEKNQPVELEFDIRNWFKMGPIKYHNVVATLRGTQYPDEYIVLGGHFDCFSSATGAIDDGSGFATAMEAARIVKASGARPKRSIIVILFAAEENGLVGSQSWLKKHPELQSKIVMAIARDHTPGAITGITVPGAWYADFERIAAPLANLNPKWPFKVTRNDYPAARPERAGGTDLSAFSMDGVPTPRLSEDTNYVYNTAWHTLNDLYNELVPYTDHQKHTALVTAVLTYGVANLDKPLTRDGVYLPDGLYADITVGAGDAPRRVMVSLDYAHAPIQVANFIRIAEGKTPPAAGGGRGGPGGRGGRGPEVPPIGTIVDVKGGMVNGIVVSDIQKSVAIPRLPKTRNAALTHDAAGILGASSPNGFYLTLKKNQGLDGKYTAIGKVLVGLDLLADIRKGDPIRSIRITRVGQAARDFKTDDEAFNKLVPPTAKKK